MSLSVRGAWASRILPSHRTPAVVARCFRRRALFSIVCLAGAVHAADPTVRSVAPEKTVVLVASRKQPEGFRYTAFPAVLRTGPGEVWIVYKAGRSHATDAGSALEVVRHELSSERTELVQRMIAPAPKLYQMGEFVRQADGSVGLYVDVQSVGWDGRHYRSGAEVFRWNAGQRRFDPPVRLAPVNGVLYGYPLDFITEERTTWLLIMAFGYHQPGGRWSVDALRSDDSGQSWRFVRNLTDEFGGIRANESGFVRHDDGFIVSTRGYDGVQRLHRTDREFKVRHQVQLTGTYPFVNSYVGRPRLFIRDGHGYLIGRNLTERASVAAGKSAARPRMQLCLIRFEPESLAATSCVVLDNADNRNVTDGYYAVTAFTGEGAETRLHVITYKAMAGQPPDIVRLDYRWSEVR